jgi:hypothetical protein
MDEFEKCSRKHDNMTFMNFYIYLMDYNANKLKDDLVDEKAFKFNLWNNFALNFSDPTFCVFFEKNPELMNKLQKLISKITIILEEVYKKSNIFINLDLVVCSDNSVNEILVKNLVPFFKLKNNLFDCESLDSMFLAFGELIDNLNLQTGFFEVKYKLENVSNDYFKFFGIAILDFKGNFSKIKII